MHHARCTIIPPKYQLIIQLIAAPSSWIFNPRFLIYNDSGAFDFSPSFAVERVAEFSERLSFLIAGNTRDDVACEAADDCRCFDGKLQGVDQ